MNALIEELDRNNPLEFFKLYQNIINDLRKANDNVSISRHIQSEPNVSEQQ